MIKQYFFIALFSVLLMACQAKQIKVEPVVKSSNCRLLEENMLIIDDEQKIPTRMANKYPFNFKEYLYLLVGAGEKTTGGYHYEVVDDFAYIDGGKVVLPIKFVQPLPGYMQTQAMTSPCVILSVKRSEVEDYIDADIEFVLSGDI